MSSGKCCDTRDSQFSHESKQALFTDMFGKTQFANVVEETKIRCNDGFHQELTSSSPACIKVSGTVSTKPAGTTNTL